MLIVAGILVGMTTIARSEEKRADEYFLSPTNGIMCSVHAPNPDGTRDAVGTDFTGQHQVAMETLRLYRNQLAHKTWTIDRETSEVSNGGYAVFRKHCAPLMEQLPNDLRKQFEPYFAN